MSSFSSPETGDFDKYFMTTTDLIDNFLSGNLWTWGYNYNGELGDNTRILKSSPVQTVCGGTNWKTHSAGAFHVSAIKIDGTLWSWGYNEWGQVGNNSTTNRSSPVQIVSGGNNWKSVSCGDYHSAAIKTDGTLWAWGHNGLGQLGNNTGVHRSSPVQTVCGGNNWKSLALSNTGNITGAIKTDGTLWMWGEGNVGQLGNNSTANRSSPVQTIAGGSNWKSVVASGTVAGGLKVDGTLWIWGANTQGQLGDNTTINKSSPVQTICEGSNWKFINVGGNWAGGIKTDGTLWNWGMNWRGCLGNNSTLDKSSPIQTIAGGTNWKSIAYGNHTTMAIKTDGTLWVWGDDVYGELGINSAEHKSSPVQTIAGGEIWKSVQIGNQIATAIKFD